MANWKMEKIWSIGTLAYLDLDVYLSEFSFKNKRDAEMDIEDGDDDDGSDSGDENDDDANDDDD